MRGTTMMTMALVAVTGVSAGARSARADSDEGHVEMSFSFLGGQRSYDDTAFSYQDGGASPTVTAPFYGEPFDGVGVAGVGFDVGLAIRGVRFGVGCDWPHASVDRPAVIAAGSVTGQVRALDIREWRFAVGYEHRLGPVTPFADVVGRIARVDADVAIADQQSTYRSKTFGYSLRAGARVPITKSYFFHASGEVGLTGTVTGGFALGVGLRIP